MICVVGLAKSDKDRIELNDYLRYQVLYIFKNDPVSNMSENYMRLLVDKYHRDWGAKYLDNFRNRFLTLGQYYSCQKGGLPQFSHVYRNSWKYIICM